LPSTLPWNRACLFPALANRTAFPFQPAYIDAMTATFTGPVAAEIEKRLREALAPTHLAVTNDSTKHRGHAGDDGSGESHFTVEIESPAFVGKTRLQRQRAVNAALGELMRDRIHALAIRARAPGE
jgi:BolA family transcriptional regulator, general stress-responsive regulator